MTNKPQDTENILSAIKDMMGESSAVDGEPLPKDVLELTESIQKNANFNKKVFKKKRLKIFSKLFLFFLKQLLVNIILEKKRIKNAP